MTRWPWAVAVLALVAGCTQNNKQGPPARAEVRKVSGATMEIVPSDGQLPYCLVYTVSQKGVIRQLTMSRENRSIPCDSGRPIANTSFRVPVQEGPVKIYVFFSDQRLHAGSVSQQLFELQGRPRVTAMDFRLPGQAFVEMLEFTPEEGAAPVTGSVVTPGGEVEEGANGSAEEGSTEEMTGSAPPGMDGGTPATDGGT
jgi:hypothetical protein